MLTLDALFSLALLLFSTLLILMLLNRPVPIEAYGFETATDLMSAMKSVRLADLAQNPRYPYAAQVVSQNLTSPLNATLAESVSELYVRGRAAEARALSQEFLGNAVPPGFGVELLLEAQGTDCQGRASDYSCVYSRAGATRNYASTGRHFIYYDRVDRELRLVIYR